jgi:predicted esterase YcpF (UPF0227 family)
LTFVYLHGFRSSPASVKAAQFAGAIAALPIESRPALRVPALDHRPAMALSQIESLLAAAASPVCIVGSSLGGFYATVAAERYGVAAVLINPAIRPDESLRDYVGAQTNLYTGERFDVIPAHFDELRAMRINRITRPNRYWLLVQTGDDVLDYRQAVAFYAGAWQFVQGGGDHAFAGFDAQIPAILRFGEIWGQR